MSKPNKFSAAAAGNKNSGADLGSLIRGRKDTLEMQWMDTDLIYSEPQVRLEFAEEDIDGLALTLKGRNQKQAIVLYPANADGKYRIHLGERRWRAAKKNKEPVLAYIDKALAKPPTNKVRIIEQLRENVTRTDLKPLELAISFEELRTIEGMSVNEIAASVGKKAPFVSKHLKLINMSKAVSDLLTNGTVTYIETLNILTELYKLDQEAALKLFAEIESDGGIGRPAAQAYLDLIRGKKQNKSPAAPPENEQSTIVENTGPTEQKTAGQNSGPTEEITTGENTGAAEQTTTDENTGATEQTIAGENTGATEQTTTDKNTGATEQNTAGDSPAVTEQNTSGNNSGATEPDTSGETTVHSEKQAPSNDNDGYNVFTESNTASSTIAVIVKIDGDEWELLTNVPSVHGPEDELISCKSLENEMVAQFPASECIVSRIIAR